MVFKNCINVGYSTLINITNANGIFIEAAFYEMTLRNAEWVQEILFWFAMESCLEP
jgi:hypothetical protein